MKAIRSLRAVASLAALLVGTAALGSILRQRRKPEAFPASRSAVLDSPAARAHASRVIDSMGLVRGMRILDVGAGIGRFSIPMAKKVGPEGEVVALDSQHEMLEMVSRRAAEAGVGNINTIEREAGEGLLEQDSFDLAVLASVLGEIPEERRLPALLEIREALKPGGVLFVVEMPADPHYQTIRATKRLGEMAGFETHARRLWLGHVTELRKGSS